LYSREGAEERRGASLRAKLGAGGNGRLRINARCPSFDQVSRELTVHTNQTKRSSDFIVHLEQLDQLCGPQPGRQAGVLVEDNGPIHTSKRAPAALTACAHWLNVEWLPKYAPEPNDIELVWRDLKAHRLAHQTFTDAAALN
jgi:hypothetical protein